MDITERLRALYVEHGTNYVQEAADEIERLRGAISETVTRAELPSYSAELLAANYPTRTDASILSGPYTPTYIAAKRIEVAVAERDQLASMDDAAMDKMQAMIREQSERIVAVASYAELQTQALRDIVAICRTSSMRVSHKEQAGQVEELALAALQSTTERSASAQFDREAGSTSAPGVATRVMHGGPADFQGTPHGSEGSASPLHHSEFETGKEAALQALTDFDQEHGCSRCGWEGPMANCMDEACPGRLRHQSCTKLCDCDPEGTCGHPGDRNYRCVKEAIDRGDPDVVDVRHQVCKHGIALTFCDVGPTSADCARCAAEHFESAI